VVTDSYIPDDKSSILRLQVAMVDWETGTKIAKILVAKALPIPEESKHFA
jgi:hypothetical protein